MEHTVLTNLSVDASGFIAPMEKAKAVANDMYGTLAARQAAAAKFEVAHLAALQAEAAGQKELAAAIRERLNVEELAAKLQSRTGMSAPESQALAAGQIQAQQRIAAARDRQRGPKALPEMALTPRYLSDIEKAAARTNELRRQTDRLGPAGNNAALGFLSLTYAIQDAQYGFRGVINNIPMIAQGFGMGSGLAGTLMLAAIAGAALYPELEKLTGADMVKQIQAGADAFNESWVKASPTCATCASSRISLRKSPSRPSAGTRPPAST